MTKPIARDATYRGRVFEAEMVRTNRYLNNIIEQDHRAIKRRCASMSGFKSFASASITIAGIELAHRIRKRRVGDHTPVEVAETDSVPRASTNRRCTRTDEAPPRQNACDKKDSGRE